MNSPYTDARADYDKAVVGRDNTWYSDLAAADKTWAVAEAGARRDHGAAGVGAEAGYQRQLAMIDLNWQIALRTGYASYYTYPISQLQQSALDQKTHAQQAADLRQAIGNADAALAFALGMAGSDKTWTKGVASDSKDLRSGLAGADQAYATGMIQPAVTCDLGYMSATIGFWNRERLWGNAWNSAMGAASADFRGADLAARATALSGLASAINNPWARFQSDRANAESAWWSGTSTTTGFRATYLQWFANANGAYTLYQDAVNSLYMSHEGSRIAADSSYTADAANATAACENSLADEDKRYQHTMADATHTYVVAAAQTRHDSAIAQAMQALGLATANPSIFSSQLAAAQSAYASSEVGATATWRTGVANANLTYVTDTANSENAWVLNVAAANKTYSIGEATAYAAMGVSLAGHQRTYREQEAQTYATALTTLATTSGTPWAQLAADEASARSGYLQDIGQPWLDYTTSLINAQRDTETAGASALETLITTRANAAKASRIAAAQAHLALASSLNAADAALLSSGRYVPNLPANIVDWLFTASSFTDLTDPSDPPDPSDYQPVRSADGTYDWLLGQAFTTAPCLSSPLTGDGYAWSGYYTPPTNTDSLRDQLLRPKPPEVKLDQFACAPPAVAAQTATGVSGTAETTAPSNTAPEKTSFSDFQQEVKANGAANTNASTITSTQFKNLQAVAPQVAAEVRPTQSPPGGGSGGTSPGGGGTSPSPALDQGGDPGPASGPSGPIAGPPLPPDYTPPTIYRGWLPPGVPPHPGVVPFGTGTPPVPGSQGRNVLMPDGSVRFVAASPVKPRQIGNPSPTEQYIGNAVGMIFVGDYSGAETNAAGVVGSILFGFSGLDVYKDAADWIYGIQHWETSWSHVGSQLLNTVAFLPVIGMVKNLKHVDELSDAGKAVAKNLDQAEHAAEGAASHIGRGVPPSGVLARGTKAREVLAANLGKHSFPVDAQAHHIFGVELFDTALGKKLQKWGIDLNGAENGVWLPKHDYSGRVASLHRGRPTAVYTDEVILRLEMAKSRDEALAILNALRDDLLNGRLQINAAD